MKYQKYLFILIPLMAFVALSACKKLLPGAPESEETLAEPLADLTPAQLNQHISGDELFAKVYTPEEGLGPIFIQSSCEGCHVGDGKGHPVNMVTRFGKLVGTTFDYMENMGGSQLQQRAISGFEPEALPSGYTHKTDRLPPVNTGLGFLAAIHDSTIINFADSLDADGDGISGRINYLSAKSFTIFNNDIHITNSNGDYVGRFGKKAKEITLLDQIVFALKEDIGLTSDFDTQDIYNPQVGTQTSDNVPDPEVGSNVVNDLTFYLRTLKAPTRRNENDPDVIAGEALFESIGCGKCHISTIITAKSDVAALSEKVIHPYTDLLLHDMGNSLDDGFPEGIAESSEWRTPPLWGLGLAKDSQGGTPYYMHDGRASSIEEVIGFHFGGEATGPASNFKNLSDAEQDQVIKFLESL